MKYEELKKQATPGPLVVVDSTQLYLNAAGPRVHVADCVGQTQKGLHAGLMHAANARILAHCYNHFDEVVTALSKVALLHLSPTDACRDYVDGVLARAKEVKG